LKKKILIAAATTALVAAVFAVPAVAQPAAWAEAPLHPAYKPQPDSYVPPAKRPDANTAYIEQLKPAGTTPIRSDGHPDLTGYWNLGIPNPTPEVYGRRCNSCSEADQTKGQRGSHYYKPVYKPEYWSKVEALDYSVADTDPSYGCDPEGVPRQGIPGKIVQLDNEIWLYDGGEVRIIPLGNVGPLTEEDEDESTFRGVSHAEWKGNVLEIDSVGFGGDTWLAWEGLFHTNRMKVKERLWREGNILFYNFTVDDPTIFVRPWQSATQFKRLNANPNAFPEEPLPCQTHSIKSFFDPWQRG
jgi:hypothetical protein